MIEYYNPNTVSIIFCLFLFIISITSYTQIRKKERDRTDELFNDLDNLVKNLTTIQNTLGNENSITEYESIKKNITKLTKDNSLSELLSAKNQIKSFEKKLIKIKKKEEKEKNSKRIQQASDRYIQIDHTLQIIICEEIHRMKNRLRLMQTKENCDEHGIKVLSKRIESIEQELNSKGYEITDDTGKEYNDGMRSKIFVVPDENIPDGKEIISRVIKPGIKYNGRFIKHSEIQVNKGTKI
tara:strand:+ start:2386 stop:3105 length:720 start_codon:yes stop_codon:yes gene_type:complete